MDFFDVSYKDLVRSFKTLFKATDYPDLITDTTALISVIIIFRLIEKSFDMIYERMSKESLFHRIYSSPFMYIFPLLRSVILFLVCKELEFAKWVEVPLSASLFLLIVYRICLLLVNFSVPLVNKIVDAKFPGSGDDLKNPLALLLRISVWSVGVIVSLDNLGLSLSAMVTGLGVGGLAIAIASQRMLGDIFNFFVLSIDAPFQVGDLITVKGFTGRVEYIGIKTTRVRSLNGQYLVLTNSDLTSECVENFRKMEERRSTSEFIVSPTISVDLAKQIPMIVRKVVNEDPRARFDRVWLKSIHGPGWLFELTFYVESSSMQVYAATNHEILTNILKEFEDKKIYIRYP